MNDQSTTTEMMNDFDATTEQMIVRMSEQIDRWMQYKNKVFPVLRDWEKDTDKEKSIDDITFANDILSFAIHLSFIYCDLATAVRHYRSAKLNYEKRYAVKHINVIMVEGYRSIYGYSTDEKKKSFWNKSIKSICE
ncbi:MAG: hypothetical protein LBH22_02430, partial [Bacteroidales bacterium]|nr:hypothetical protein [Bacteroidales bacterium]